MKVSTCIMAKNEGDRMENCLKMVRPFSDEIVVLDGNSSDNTAEIARRYADKVIVRARKGSFAAERNFIMSAAKNDWVFFFDVDEVIGSDFVESVKKIKESGHGGYSAYVFPRKTFFRKTFRPLPFSYPCFTPRLVNRVRCRFVGVGHEVLAIEGRKKFVPSHILHYPENVFSKPETDKHAGRLQEKLDRCRTLNNMEDPERAEFIRSRRKFGAIPIVLGDYGFYMKSMLLDLKFYRSPSMMVYMMVWLMHNVKKFFLVEAGKIRY